MSSNRKPFMKVCLTFERREDGGLRVESSNVPELFLSHRDYNLVMDDVAPALEVILGEKYGKKVRVTTSLRAVREMLEDGGIISPYEVCNDDDGPAFVRADFEDA